MLTKMLRRYKKKRKGVVLSGRVTRKDYNEVDDPYDVKKY
jgi:hypothetical protein